MDAHTLRMGQQTRQTRALAIAIKIAKLKFEIEPKLQEMRMLEKEHALLFDRPADDEPEDEPAPRKPGRPKGPSGESVSSRILAFFSRHPEDHDSEDILKAMPDVKKATLNSTLILLHQQGKLVRTARGVYGPAVSNVTPLQRRLSTSDD